MKEKNSRDVEDIRNSSQTSEELRDGSGSVEPERRTDENWTTSGTEDPAFYIKPADEE